MSGVDWVSLRDAVVAFRQNVGVMGQHVEAAAAVSAAGQREVQAEGWAPPAWAPPGRFRAVDRLLEAGKPVLERVLLGWVAPDYEAVAGVELDNRELEREFHQSRTAFIEAVALIACAYAEHGNVWPHVREDGTHWRRVAIGSWPPECADLVPDAQAALSRWALAFLAWAGRVEGATFLGRRAA